MSEVKVILIRIKGGQTEPNEKQTLGFYKIFKGVREIFSSYMLELPWKNNQNEISCIPDNIYTVRKWTAEQAKAVGKKYDYDHFEILEVPNRTGILQHGANYVTDLRGCQAHGEALQDMNKDGLLDVVGSRKALAKAFALLPDKFTLTIISI